MRLKGKKAVVTGASKGIGKAIVQKFLQEGATVVFCGSNPERVLSAEKELAAYGGPVYGVVADVSKSADIDKLMAFAVEKLGTIDILVNNAGIAKFEPFLDISEESWNHTLSVNLTGLFLCSQAASRIMVKQNKPGAIVNMSSTNGILGEAGLAHYNASKAGIVLLSKTMAIELARHKIRVNSVCPGFILTGIQQDGGASEEEIREYVHKIPLHRYGTVEEVANAFAFLASDEASFITGTELVVDGGQICEE